MSRAQVWLQQVSNLLVAGTGVAYFVMKHLLASDDPFAVVNHPAQPLMQHLHILFAPLLVFACGAVWIAHARPRLQEGPRRTWRSGMLLLASFVPMAGSGYLLQISVEPSWRTAWTWIHVATGVLWTLGYAAHWATAVFRRVRRDAVACS